MKLPTSIIIAAILLISQTANAQIEVDEQVSLLKGNGLSSARLKQSIPADSLQINKDMQSSEIIGTDFCQPYRPTPYYATEFRDTEPQNSQFIHNNALDLSMPRYGLWRGANLAFYGSVNQMPGLMGVESGSMTYHQSLGEWQISVSANANKYWMPMQKQLVTQYGIGGTLGYQLSNDISLHAYGYYYNTNPLVGPAFNPYVTTSSFGGYANIRFNDRFSTNVGVNRYINPMTGRWTTSPIITPSFRVGKTRIELPVGELLKAAFGGDRDNPMQYREPPKRQSKKRK